MSRLLHSIDSKLDRFLGDKRERLHGEIGSMLTEEWAYRHRPRGAVSGPHVARRRSRMADMPSRAIEITVRRRGRVRMVADGEDVDERSVFAG